MKYCVRFSYFLLTLFALLLNSCILEEAEPISEDLYVEEGIASYYADRYEGRPTASGEPYRKSLLTAAHKTLPFGTIVTVTNKENGKVIEVKVNDRGPFVEGRIIDLSRAAAEELDFIQDGLTEVRIEAAPE